MGERQAVTWEEYRTLQAAGHDVEPPPEEQRPEPDAGKYGRLGEQFDRSNPFHG